MSLRKWVDALISAPQARGKPTVNAESPKAPAMATQTPLGPHGLQRVNWLSRKFIKRITLAGTHQKCTLILPDQRPERASSRIVSSAVAAEVTRRKCFSRKNPPPYVGGYSLGRCPGNAPGNESKKDRKSVV